MANPALTEKKFKEVLEDDPGWAAPPGSVGLVTGSAAGSTPAPSTTPATSAGGDVAVPAPGTKVMTANGTFAKTFFLFLFVLAGGAFGWQQVSPSPVNAQQIDFPGWIWLPMPVAFGCAMVCIFKAKLSPVLGPVYALLEGVALGAISKLFELHWSGIVLQAVLATVATFFVTLALYVFGVVKVTKKFQVVVIAATLGIFLLYFVTMILSFFGADITFWNNPTPLGIGISVVICAWPRSTWSSTTSSSARPARRGAPKYMEWYGAFGLMVTLMWLYLEILRLLSLLRQ